MEQIWFQPRTELTAPKLAELAVLDDPAFRTLFSKSPVKRLGRNRFVRNVLIAIGNSEDEEYLPLIESLLEDPSPIVRVAAVWALGRIAEGSQFWQLRDRLYENELDHDVREEWRLSSGDKE